MQGSTYPPATAGTADQQHRLARPHSRLNAFSHIATNSPEEVLTENSLAISASRAHFSRTSYRKEELQKKSIPIVFLRATRQLKRRSNNNLVVGGTVSIRGSYTDLAGPQNVSPPFLPAAHIRAHVRCRSPSSRARYNYQGTHVNALHLVSARRTTTQVAPVSGCSAHACVVVSFSVLVMLHTKGEAQEPHER